MNLSNSEIGHFPREFDSLDWRLIAYYMGATFYEERPKKITLYTKRWGVVKLYDNGGELNIIAEAPALTPEAQEAAATLANLGRAPQRYEVWWRGLASLPYTHTHKLLTEMAMQLRIRCWLDNADIDWDYNEANPLSRKEVFGTTGR